MATNIDRFNPTFSLFPIQNARTAWRPVYIPTVLAVPQKRTLSGADIGGSNVFNLRFLIEDAPGSASVAGFKNEGIIIPTLERFATSVADQALPIYKVAVEGQEFESADGSPISFAEAQNGDYFYLTLENGGVRDKITYYTDADYYDLSTITISTIELTPLGKYNFVWQASYYERVKTQDDELFCISSVEKLTRLSVTFNHPGDVHRAMVQNTPGVYFDGQSFDKDTTVDFYRVFADVLQDIFDEQGFIRGLNWIDKIPAQYIPYLGFLLGWDLPYFNGIDDNVRRSFIRNARKIQKLKGSKRAINELFEIFGFTIDIVNLWYRSDGKAFLGPYDSTSKGFENDYVTLTNVCATEPIISDSTESGFGDFVVPLLYRPTGNITIEAFITTGGTSRSQLLNVVSQTIADPDSTEQTTCSSTNDGMLISDALNINTSTVTGYAKIVVDRISGEGLAEIQMGNAPLNRYSVTYDRDTNQLRIIYDKYLDLSSSYLFIFAIYNRDKITPSESLADLRSNRFDIRVLLFKDGTQPDSDVYDFLLDFLFKIKSFHSLLRKIVFSLNLEGVYNVTDFCLGGINKQGEGTTGGELQVPPPIIPNEPTCVSDLDRGFKTEDLTLRSKIIAGLEEEHAAWKNMDGTHVVPDSLRPLLESMSRIAIPVPDDSPCEFTQFGQDRVEDVTIDLDQNPDTREKICDISTNTKDYCYKGRAADDLGVSRDVLLNETVRFDQCTLSAGKGLYWTNNLSSNVRRWFNENNYHDSWSDRQFVGKAAWGNRLHYSDKSLIDNDDPLDAYIAIRRPSLEIMKDNMFFPGHRFIQMFALESDFTQTEYNLRPWDTLLNLPCSEDVPVQNGQPVIIPDLNARIEIGTDGEEWLIFDEYPLTYYGNGLVPDVTSLGDHFGTDAVVSEDDVTHTIYTTSGPLVGSGEDIVEFDTLDYTSSETICVDVGRAIFASANQDCVCGTDAIEDIPDGNPSETGRYQYDPSTEFISGILDGDGLAALIGLDVNITGAPSELIFRVGSGIRADLVAPPYKPYRLDCGCSMIDCDTTAQGTIAASPTIERCNMVYFVDQNGVLDFDHDKIDIFSTMVLRENVAACSLRLNGELSSLLVIDQDKVTTNSSGVTSYKFIDDWGIINTGSFITDGTKMDITWTTFEPRVWGEPDTGYKQGTKVFRKGTITTQRQILQTLGGQIYILAEGFEQYIGYFQANVVCGDTRAIDPFIYHNDCAITDEIEFEISCGPKWSEPGSDSSSWPEITVGPGGEAIVGSTTGDGDPFFWIDVWGNEEGGEVTVNC